MPSWKKVVTSGSNAVLNQVTSSAGINAVGPFTFQTTAAANDTIFRTAGTSGKPLTLKNSNDSAVINFQTNGDVANVLMSNNSKSNLLKLSADGLTETRGQVGSAHADGNLELYSNNGLNNLILSASMTTISGSGDTTLDVKGNISGVSASFSYVTASKVEVDASTLTIGGTALTKTDADNVKNVSNTNSGDVTLSGTPDYITISNQVITRNQIDLTADVTGTLPVGNGGTGVTSMTNLKNALDDETWTFAEKLTADAGIDIDNINIDGTTIALSSGDLTLDVEGDIILDANGADIKLKDNGTEFGRLSRVSSDLVIKSISNNNDMLFKGVDNTSTITALTLDMSESGDAYFNNDISGSTIRASGDVIAFNSSDERFKDNIQPISEPLWKLSKIGGYEFDWNDKQDVYEGHDVGVIAQEVHKVLPEVVGEKSDGYLGVKYEKIVPLLIESVKELTKKTKKLERELKKLKRK